MTRHEGISNILKRISKYLFITLILFILLHVATFVFTFARFCSNEHYVKGRLYMSAAATVNALYLSPLYRFSEFNAPKLKRFKEWRNYFYTKGLEYYPKNEGEKYVWWFVLYFSEFEENVEEAIYSYATFFSRDKKHYEKKEIQLMFDWTERVHEKIYQLAKAPIKDKNIREKRLNMVNAMIYRYFTYRYILVVEYNNDEAFINYKIENEVDRTYKLFNLYTWLREYSIDNEPESINFFKKLRRHFEDYKLIFELSTYILKHKMLYQKPFSCDAKFVNELGDSFKKLQTEYDITPGYHNYERKLSLFACPDNKRLEYLKKHCENSAISWAYLRRKDGSLNKSKYLKDLEVAIEKDRRILNEKK